MPQSITLRRWAARELSEPGSTNLYQVVRLIGRFRPAAFAHAADLLTLRHEALRTRFGFDADGPFLQSRPVGTITPDLTYCDLGLIDPGRADRVVFGYVRRAFDLRRAPPIRFGLFRLGRDDLVLAVAASHLVVDGWSLTRLAHELGTLYLAPGEPGASRTDPRRPQFADFVAWQNRWLEGLEFAETLAFWFRTLAPVPPAPFPVSPGAVPGVRVVEFALGPEAAAIRSRAKRLGLTPFACVLTALFRSLCAVSGRSDLVVVTSTANRMQPDLSATIGLIMNFVALRCRAADAPVDESLGHVWTALKAANYHGSLPLEVVLDGLRRAGQLQTTALAHVFVAWNDIGLRGLSLPGVRVEPFADPYRMARGASPEEMPLVVEFALHADRLDIVLSHRPDCLDETRVAALVAILRKELATG